MVTKVGLEGMGDNRDRSVASKASCKVQEQSILRQNSVMIKQAAVGSKIPTFTCLFFSEVSRPLEFLSLYCCQGPREN